MKLRTTMTSSKQNFADHRFHINLLEYLIPYFTPQIPYRLYTIRLRFEWSRKASIHNSHIYSGNWYLSPYISIWWRTHNCLGGYRQANVHGIRIQQQLHKKFTHSHCNKVIIERLTTKYSVRRQKLIQGVLDICKCGCDIFQFLNSYPTESIN